jgi:PRTRC genetic system protein C
MTVKVSVNRIFKYNSLILDDPDPKWSIEEVKDFYANAYPELTQSIIEGPDVSDEGLTYTFRKSVGTKGNETISISRIAYDSYQIPSDRKIAVVTDLMQHLGNIIVFAQPDGDDLLAPSEFQEVI